MLYRSRSITRRFFIAVYYYDICFNILRADISSRALYDTFDIAYGRASSIIFLASGHSFTEYITFPFI